RTAQPTHHTGLSSRYLRVYADSRPHNHPQPGADPHSQADHRLDFLSPHVYPEACQNVHARLTALPSFAFFGPLTLLRNLYVPRSKTTHWAGLFIQSALTAIVLHAVTACKSAPAPSSSGPP